MSVFSTPKGRLVAVVVVLVAIIASYSWVMTHLAWKRALQQTGFIDETPGPGSGDRILVVAPHPDDEALGCAGVIRKGVTAGAEVHVVLMTNGDASELALIFGERELSSSPEAFVKLGRARQTETLRAMAMLGLPPSHIHFLGYPNNGLVPMWRPEHWFYSSLYQSPYTHTSFSPYERTFTPQAPYCGQQVLSDLVTILHQVRPTQVYVVHHRDVHPDHWATYCFLRFALETVALRTALASSESPENALWARQVKVFGYLIHWPHYPVPRARATNLDLLPPVELSREAGSEARPREWLRMPLDPEDTTAKLRAIMAYRSQEPSFDRLLVAFARRNESFEQLRVVDLSPLETAAAHPPTALPYSAQWLASHAHRRKLGGADLTALTLTVQDNLVLRAELTGAPHRIPANGYVALDLRTWDTAGLPVITTVYVRRGPRGRALQAAATRSGPGAQSRPLPDLLSTPAAGQVVIAGVPLPPDSFARTRLFLSCWGSVRDRVTFPLAIAPLDYAPLPEGE
jgi:LmbE family N-acetylglucosaminyl deacetylase